jgi:uncharacterized protein with HEPN domain
MPSDLLAALKDMEHHIHLAQEFLAGSDLQQFSTDLRANYAVTRCLEIISEASRRLPDDLKAQYPAIPWRAIAGAGNVYRHDYEHVESWIIWNTVTSELPPLLEVVQTEIKVRS